MLRRAGPDWARREGRTLAGPFPEEDEDAGQSDAEPVGAPVPPAPGGPPGGPWLDDAWGPPPPVRTAARGQQAACVLVTIKQEQQLEPVAPAW